MTRRRPLHVAGRGWLPALLALLALLATARGAHANDPTAVWRTLETPHFYIHYYRSVRHDERELAQRVASAAEQAHEVLSQALGHAPSSKTHLVLTDDTDGANGSAQSVPMNIVRLYATGPSSLSALNDYDDWIYGLIIHEYTHILHIDTIHGLAKIVNYILGRTWAPNQIQPRWFIEGLAVYYESARTAGGRIRSSIFDMYLRSAVLEGKLLTLDQITSNPRIFPWGNAPYLYGSRFLHYLAERFGEEKLTKMGHLYGGTVIPYGINRIAKEVVGRTFVELYADFKQHLERRYELQRDAAARRGLTTFRKITDHGESSGAPVFSRDGRELAFIDTDGHSQTSIKLLDLKSGKVTQRYEIFGGSGLDLTPDGRQLVYGESSTWRSFYSFDDLFVRDRASGAVRRLTRGMRARDPAVSPDGRQVAFTSSELGQMDLRLMPFQGGPQRVLHKGTASDQIFTPRWSPDGKRLVYSRWKKGGERDIYLMDVASGRARRLTADRALDTDPSFSADGRRVYFSSDRTGIFNIYCYDLERDRLFQVSNVLGGAFSPTISPDETEAYYVGFTAKGYDLHAMKLDRGRYLPALPYVNRRPPPPEVARREYPEGRYNPLQTLYPRNWMFNLGQDAFGTAFGIDLAGSDVAGRHRFALSTVVGTARGTLSYGLSYGYYRFWPSLDVDHSRYLAVRGGMAEDGVRRNYIEENYSAGLYVGLPVLRLPNHSVTLSVGYRFNYFKDADGDQQHVVLPGELSPVRPQLGVLSGVTMGASYASLQRYSWSVSNAKGRYVSFSLRVDHPTFGSDFKTTTFSYGWSEFIPMPWWYDHVLALRLAGGIGSGDLARRGLFFIGGFPEQDVLRSFFDPTSRVGGAFLRGYPPGVVYGDQYHLLNVEYRFPLFSIEKGFSTLPLYFNNVHATAFVDVGNAFFGDPVLSDFKVGVGAELLLECVIGYYLPSTFRFGYARGLMDKGGNAFHFLLGSVF